MKAIILKSSHGEYDDSYESIDKVFVVDDNVDIIEEYAVWASANNFKNYKEKKKELEDAIKEVNSLLK
jgi:ribosomal protein L4